MIQLGTSAVSMLTHLINNFIASADEINHEIFCLLPANDNYVEAWGKLSLLGRQMMGVYEYVPFDKINERPLFLIFSIQPSIYMSIEVNALQSFFNIIL